MQVHVVTPANADRYGPELEQFFAERHKIYAEELRWVPVSPDGQERDVFDTPRAVYFLGIEEDRVIAGSRLNPTTEPHLLSEEYAHLCTRNGGLIVDPTVAEWTRGFVVRAAREGTNKRILFEFCAGIMEYALEEGLTMLGGIQRTYWLSMWKRMGWKVHIHGEPVLFDGDPWLPAYFDVSEEALEGARKWGKLDGPILVQRGPRAPFVPCSEIYAAP